MRIAITILATALLAALAEWLGSWWYAAVVAGIIGIFAGLRTGKAFVAGFCGIALMWLAVLLVKDIANGHIFTRKLAQLFHLPSFVLYIISTFLLGGMVGGLPAWAGAHLRRMFMPIVDDRKTER